jgi:hypothetical protein
MAPYPEQMGMPVPMPIAQPMMMQTGVQMVQVDHHGGHHSQNDKQKKIEKLRKKYEGKGLFHYNRPCFYGMVCGFFCGILSLFLFQLPFC